MNINSFNAQNEVGAIMIPIIYVRTHLIWSNKKIEVNDLPDTYVGGAL